MKMVGICQDYVDEARSDYKMPLRSILTKTKFLTGSQEDTHGQILRIETIDCIVM